MARRLSDERVSPAQQSTGVRGVMGLEVLERWIERKVVRYMRATLCVAHDRLQEDRNGGRTGTFARRKPKGKGGGAAGTCAGAVGI